MYCQKTKSMPESTWDWLMLVLPLRTSASNSWRFNCIKCHPKGIGFFNYLAKVDPGLASAYQLERWHSPLRECCGLRGVTALQKPLPQPVSPLPPLSAPCSHPLHPTAAAPAVCRQLACQLPVDPQLRPTPGSLHLIPEARLQHWVELCP